MNAWHYGRLNATAWPAGRSGLKRALDASSGDGAREVPRERPAAARADEAAREASRAHLRAALAKNAALRLQGGALEAAAQVRRPISGYMLSHMLTRGVRDGGGAGRMWALCAVYL